jgi:transposase
LPLSEAQALCETLIQYAVNTPDRLDTLLSACKQQGWRKAKDQARTDSTHELAAMRQLNRLECVGETLRQALATLVAPEWLRQQVDEDWFERYSSRIEAYRLPKDQPQQQQLPSPSAAMAISY